MAKKIAFDFVLRRESRGIMTDKATHFKRRERERERDESLSTQGSFLFFACATPLHVDDTYNALD